MTFDDWITQQGKGDALGVALAREAWETAQATERVEFYRRANWASLNGMFSPAQLRDIADQIERGYGIS